MDEPVVNEVTPESIELRLKRRVSKWFWVIGGILGLVILGVGIWFLLGLPPRRLQSDNVKMIAPSPTAILANSMANWKTYDLGGTLSFKYPEDKVTFSGANQYTVLNINDTSSLAEWRIDLLKSSCTD